MGSMIHLTLGRIELDWGKNSGFADHSALFRPGDVAQIPYYYAGDQDDPEFAHLPLIRRSERFSYRLITEFKEGCAAPLRTVARRLLLLGYTDEICREEFERGVEDSYVPNHDFSWDELKKELSRADFSGAAFGDGLPSEHPLDFLINEAWAGRPDLLSRLHRSGEYDGELDGVGAYGLIRLLAENSTAQDLLVTWQFADVLNGGWAPREAFDAPLRQPNRFLVVTEGPSDVNILRKAIGLLAPDLADFFDYVDMHENYPFSGTGNLYNFVRGLISIGIQNNIIVVFDNDAEGVFNWERASRLNTLPNMRIVKLPDREEFRLFPTVGPSGPQKADINGKAAAIECYLDVGEAPLVRWTSYDQRRDCYQGQIVEKEAIARRFLEQRQIDADYDYSGIQAVLTMLIAEAVSISTGAAEAILEGERPAGAGG